MIDTRLLSVPLALLVCSACIQAEPAVEGQTDDTTVKRTFTASGNEPGWTLQLTDDQLELNLAYGERQISTSLPAAEQVDGGLSYLVPDTDIEIHILNQACQDNMTGMPYPMTVSIKEDNKVLNGCGGQPNDLLIGDEWQVVSIAGEPVPEGIAVSIAFLEDGRLAGRSGCNRVMGQYQLTGEGLNFGRLITTRMACPEPQMRIEHAFLAVLEQVYRFELDQGGDLLLKTADNAEVRAQR